MERTLEQRVEALEKIAATLPLRLDYDVIARYVAACIAQSIMDTNKSKVPDASLLFAGVKDWPS